MWRLLVNAFKPGLGSVAKMGVTGLMNGLDSVINGAEGQKQVTYDIQRPVTYNDGGGGYPQSKNTLLALPYDKALSFQMKDVSPDFVPHAKGFIGKRPRTAF